MNRRAIAMTFFTLAVFLSVCQSGMGVHCDHTVHVKEDLSLSNQIKSNQIYLRHKPYITECDIIIRQMCRQDTKAEPTALTGALGSKNTNYNSK